MTPAPDDVHLASIAPLLPQFREFDRLGRGAMGAVYAVYDRSMGMRVALKLSWHLPGIDDGHALRQRFRREVGLLCRSHTCPNLVRVYRWGEEVVELTGRRRILLWYTMELCEGSLRDALPGLTLPARVALALQIVDALSYLEAWRIAHRDLKPQNLFLASRPPDPPMIKLGDFGIAKGVAPEGEFATALTRSEYRMGAPLYMAPELFHPGRPVDYLRADQYAAGLVLWETLSLRMPWGGELRTVPELMRAKSQELAPLSIPECGQDLGPLDRVIRRMSQPDPDRRYADLAVCGRALRNALALCDLLSE